MACGRVASSSLATAAPARGGARAPAAWRRRQRRRRAAPAALAPGSGAGAEEAAHALARALGSLDAALGPLADAGDASEPGYAKTSYYTTLGLYLLSLPGLYSLVKRSTKAKEVQKTYAVPGPAVEGEQGGKQMDALAREVSTFFIRNNYNIAEAGEVVTFRGNIQRSRGQASFQVFCTFIGLGSLALVLSTIYPGIGDNFYWMTLVSPLAGVYYWDNAAQVEEVKVKLVTNDDNTETEVRVQGGADAVEDFRRALDLNEKGMVRVKGVFE